MIALPSNARVWLAWWHTDMRRGFGRLASQVQQHLGHDPFDGQYFVFRGKRGHLIKVLCRDGQGLCLFAKRLEKGRFVWPQAKEGAVPLTPTQLSMLLEGIGWRMPARTWRPGLAGRRKHVPAAKKDFARREPVLEDSVMPAPLDPTAIPLDITALRDLLQQREAGHTAGLQGARAGLQK
jgi:transposase